MIILLSGLKESMTKSTSRLLQQTIESETSSASESDVSGITGSSQSPNYDFIMKVMESVQMEHANDNMMMGLRISSSTRTSTVAPSTYIDWLSSITTSTRNKNKITVIYHINPSTSYPNTFWSGVFPKGYIGIQRHDDLAEEARGMLIFSVWDVDISAFTEKNDDFWVQSFGGEGTGGSVRKFITGTNAELFEKALYSFKVVYENDAASSTATVTGYYAINERNIFDNDDYDNSKFIKIAKVIVPNNNDYLFNGYKRFNQFMEDWTDYTLNNGVYRRKGIHNDLMIKTEINGIVNQWKVKDHTPALSIEARPYLEGNNRVYYDSNLNAAIMEIGGIIEEQTTEIFNGVSHGIHWKQIMVCTEGIFKNGLFNWIHAEDERNNLAQSAITMKIQPRGGHTNDEYNKYAVVAIPGSKPMQRLNKLEPLSCDENMSSPSDLSEWNGSNEAKNRLITTNGCSNGHFAQESGYVYWAYGNVNGMHIIPNYATTKELCRWEWSAHVGQDIEVYYGEYI